MRILLICALLALGALACGEEVNRLDGPGCQPACMTQDTEGDSPAERTSVCLDEDLLPDSCAANGDTPVCAMGTISCETDAPTCTNSEAIPTCQR